jgi:propionyl-CoA carboxylase alpha chain
LPSIGRLVRYRPPTEGTREDGSIVRNDTGVYEGGEISMYYDPMIAKLCTWGEDRMATIQAMRVALDNFEITKIGHNIPFLAAVMEHDRFERGDLSTNYIAQEFPDGFEGAELNPGDRRKLACVCALMCQILARRDAGGSGVLTHHQRIIPADLAVEIDGMNYAVNIQKTNGIAVITSTDESDKAAIELEVSIGWTPGAHKVAAIIDNVEFTFFAQPIAQGYRVQYRGADVEVRVRTCAAAKLVAIMPEKTIPDTSNFLLCPMPGIIVDVLVEPGDKVEDGQALAIVEAMKMENTLRAEKKSTIKSVAVKQGDNLAVDAVIMEFE